MFRSFINWVLVHGGNTFVDVSNIDYFLSKFGKYLTTDIFLLNASFKYKETERKIHLAVF